MGVGTIALIVAVIAAIDVLFILIKYNIELRKEREKLKEIAEVTYNFDPDFKSYVDKYMKKHNLTLEEAFKSRIVKLYLEYIKSEKSRN